MFKYISEMDCVKDLPVDVLSKIDSEKNWRPEIFERSIEENTAQYKISRLGPKITRHLKSRKKIYIIEYCIMREGVPFSLKSIEDIITEEKE